MFFLLAVPLKKSTLAALLVFWCALQIGEVVRLDYTTSFMHHTLFSTPAKPQGHSVEAEKVNGGSCVAAIACQLLSLYVRGGDFTQPLKARHKFRL